MSSEQEYRNKFALSQSSIKDWEEMSPYKWHATWVTKTLKRKTGASVGFGSLLDCLVLTQHEFEKRFFKADIDLPSDNIVKCVEGVFDHQLELIKNAMKLNKQNPNKKIPVPEFNLDDQDLIQKLAKENNYYAKTPVRAYNEVMKAGVEYFNLKKEAGTRDIVSSKDVETATQLRDILYTNKISKGFFTKTKFTECVFQQRIYSEIEVSGFENVEIIPLKGAIDDVYFNHRRKTVREIDLKWTNDAFMFRDAVRRFKYARQHSFYDFLLREWLKTYRDGEFKDYTVDSPLNVVIDSDDKLPYLYQYNQNDLYLERYGHENMPWFKGWEQVINEIAWHMDKQEWTHPKDHVLNGAINLKNFKS